MSGSTYNSRQNEITYKYYCQLRSHSWSRDMAYKVEMRNGSHSYFVYFLVK